MYKFKKKIRAMFLVIASLPKTIYFNFATFPFKTAIKLPVLVSYKTKIYDTHKGCIEYLPSVKKIYPFMTRFGVGGSDGIIERPYSVLFIEKGGKLFFGDLIRFCPGFSLRVKGTLTIGDYFLTNKNVTISCYESVTFGEDSLVGWNSTIRDSDGHPVFHDGVEVPMSKPIKIGNHTWIGAESHVLKGTELGDGCLLAYRSLLVKTVPGENLLIGGSPAKLIRGGMDHTH